MNKKVDDYLRSHPYFTAFSEEDEQEVYAFSYKEKKIFLCVDKHFDAANSSFPLVPLDTNREYITNFWKMPKWFKEVEVKANELFFESNRLKLLVENERRKFHNILYYHTYEERYGKEFWESYANNNFSVRENYQINITYRPILERAREKLLKYGYTLENVREEGDYVIFDISLTETGGKSHAH